MIKKLNNTGDTIIEVLICLAVLGLVIGSAYGIINKSLRTIQDAQERSQALKIAEGQIEQIKANPTTALITDTIGGINYHCKTTTGCFFDNRYWVDVTTSPHGVLTKFTVKVTWDGLINQSSGTKEQLILIYEIKT